MIYITGDCHQDFRRFSTRIFPEQKEMTKEDYVIICGDFGGVWNKGEESREEKHLMDWLEGKSFTTLFVDGNHENFDRLYGYPVEEWHGGRVHKIRPSVIHMMASVPYQPCKLVAAGASLTGGDGGGAQESGGIWQCRGFHRDSLLRVQYADSVGRCRVQA